MPTGKSDDGAKRREVRATHTGETDRQTQERRDTLRHTERGGREERGGEILRDSTSPLRTLCFWNSSFCRVYAGEDSAL